MKVIFAADHAGFELKEILKTFVASLGYDIEDVGAHTLDATDDYPQYVAEAARMVVATPDARGIVVGGSGQGEAIAANRVKGIRAVVYYGTPKQKQTDSEGNTIGMIESVRSHNDANVLSLGARFLSPEEAKEAVRQWLSVPFSGAERHVRRNHLLDV